MKKTVFIILGLSFLCLTINAQATSIIDDLNSDKVGQGKINIYQDDAIKNLVGSVLTRSANNTAIMQQLSNTSDNKSQRLAQTKGFKIQVYSGSDQKRAKDEAQSRRSAVRSAYPNMEVSVSYTSPVWRVKAGNFKTKEQASQALSDMKQKLPTFGREMYIINDIVKIPVE